jgi:hypothetical protein
MPRHAAGSTPHSQLVRTGNEYVLARRDGVLLDGRTDGAKRTELTLTPTPTPTLSLTLTLILTLTPTPTPTLNLTQTQTL